MADTLTASRFAIVPEWVIYSDLSDRAVRLYAVLHRKADNDGTNAFPSRQWLADALGCSPRSVDRAVDELVVLGAVDKRERRRTDGSRTSNEYLVRTDPPTPVTGGGDSSGEAPPTPVARGGDSSGEGSTQSPYTESPSTEIDTSDPDGPDSPFPDVATDETTDRARDLCNLFAGYVKSNGHAVPTSRSARDRWLVEMERLVRIGPPGDVDWPDDPEDANREIRRVMGWALAESSFWPANVRSVPKFREQFTRLRAQAARSGGTASKRSKYERLQREGLA